MTMCVCARKRGTLRWLFLLLCHCKMEHITSLNAPAVLCLWLAAKGCSAPLAYDTHTQILNTIKPNECK